MAANVKQLIKNGVCTLDSDVGADVLPDLAEILNGWFQHSPEQQKQLATTAGSTAAVERDTGRGYFSMPAKELLEVGKGWKCQGASAELRLAVHGSQQLQELLGQKHLGRTRQSSSGSDNNSVLHINKYRSPGAAPPSACLLQGDEAHVDKGLLTVIWATQPGLQVLSRDGSRVPIAPGPHQLVILVGHTLSFLTAGRLPAAMHRVALNPTTTNKGTRSTEESTRLSLCFNLHAAPDALLSPADVMPPSLEPIEPRYQASKTVKQLMEEFDALHTSLHAQRSQQQRQRQQLLHPPVPAAAVSVKREPSSSSPEHAAKRPCQQRGPSSAPSRNHSMPQPLPQFDLMTLVFRNQEGSDVCFKVRPNIQLGTLILAYARKMSQDAGSAPVVTLQDVPQMFRFDGQRVQAHLTPLDYEMEDGDIIDVTVPGATG